MKVSEIISRIDDIQICIDRLEEWQEGTITENSKIEALVDDIDEHLHAYVELLMNKETK